MYSGPPRKTTLVSPIHHAPSTVSRNKNYSKQHEMDFHKMYMSMEKGHRVCRLNVLKKWDPSYKYLTLKNDTRQLYLTKIDQGTVRSKPEVLDIRHVREVQTLEYKFNTIKISDKWKKDKEIASFDSNKIVVISYGTSFTLRHWILLFESSDASRLWSQGVHNLMIETRDRDSSCHTVRIERFLGKHFYNLATPANECVARKLMKPFVQTSLQYKVQSRQLQEVTEEQMNYYQFAKASKQLVYLPALFTSRFADLSDDGATLSFNNFLMFLEKKQNDDLAQNRSRALDFVKRFLNHEASNHDRIEPTMTVMEFCDFLFSRENSLWDRVNEKVTQDMTRPLSHYFIASSHNTYLTGDQLKSESSLDSYAQALLMGCRCIEIDCWDGQKKPNSNEFQDIVIYHGYTMTTKLNLRDVLQTIRHYAFVTSEYPVIISIEDNCSVPAQRLLAKELREILGDYILNAPVNKDEKELPSPASLKRKIIIKHKKLPIESEELPANVPLAAIVNNDEFQDQDIMVRPCVKRGRLYLKDSTSHEWTQHVFVLFPDRICYLLEQCTEDGMDDTASMMGEEDREEEALGFGVKPEEVHITEEWYHAKCERQDAVKRLLEYQEKGNGLFMIRESNLFIGDFSLSVIHDGRVHHVRIKTKMVNREKKYFFMDNMICDTLYELVSYYTRHPLTTPDFNILLITPCPQPQPHLTQPWFNATADKAKAEELLNQVHEDGAFLIRYSGGDNSVFVLSLRVDGEFWHYRLKRNGRIFVVNQTVFASLNELVDYYSTREFVRGISLRFPVNERDVGHYGTGDMAVAAPGQYMDIKDLDKEIQARALRPYRGVGDDELTFPANAVISVLRKEEDMWRGRYGSSTGWFPAAFVQVITPEKETIQDVTNYKTIELAGTVVERTSDSERPFALKIVHNSNQHWNGQSYMLAAQSVEDLDDWINNLHELTKSVNTALATIRTKEKSARIAAELSNLVVYCQAVPFDPSHVTDGSFYEMCSFVENKLDKLVEKGLVQYNIRQVSRVYPHGGRITSTNYSPVPMWNAGCHMVALNYQTGDKPMQLNQGKFMENGTCGYVLKPDYMMETGFDPTKGSLITSCPIRLTVNLIAGRHLSRKDKNKGICSPFVEVEVIGLGCDDRFYKSKTISSNGLNPIWGQTFTFEIQCPEVALLRFHVEDADFLGPKTDPFIGQAVYPVGCIRSGFRSIPLKNQFSEELELSSLLVDVQMCTMTDGAPSALIKSTRSVVQGPRLAAVHRKGTANSGDAPREMAPLLHSLDEQNSVDVPLSPPGSISKKSLTNSFSTDRKTSEKSLTQAGSQRSLDSNGSSSPINGNRKKWSMGSLNPFKSRDKEK